MYLWLLKAFCEYLLGYGSMFILEICDWFQRTFDPNTYPEISMFAALQLRIFISHWPSSSLPAFLWHTDYISASLSTLETAVCSSPQTWQQMELSMHSHARAHTHTRTPTYRQDTRQTNCLFPPCCVSNLLIMLAKSSYTTLPLSSMRLISQSDRHKYWPGVHNPCSRFSSISKVREKKKRTCRAQFYPTFTDLCFFHSSGTLETLCLK